MRVKFSSLVILSVAQVPAREQAFGDKEHLTVDIRHLTCASYHASLSSWLLSLWFFFWLSSRLRLVVILLSFWLNNFVWFVGGFLVRSSGSSRTKGWRSSGPRRRRSSPRTVPRSTRSVPPPLRTSQAPPYSWRRSVSQDAVQLCSAC